MTDIIMRFKDGKRKALTLSYDDGVEQDIRLIDIMKRYGLKGTFNLNSGLYKDCGTVYEPGTIHRRMSRDEVSALYVKNGMEVAVHGLTHPFLEELPVNICLEEVVKDRENLEKQFDVIVRGMAYPYGTYSDQVIEILKQVGIVYARTVISSGNFRIPTDWFQLEATCHHKDPHLMELAVQFVEDEAVKQGKPLLFYLWGHSYEFESDDNWNVIEEFAEYMGNREDFWYATNLEIYEYIENYKRLVFSMDGTRVQNPTSQDLYLDKSGELKKIPAGQMIEL